MIDTHELDAFADDLAKVAETVTKDAKAVVGRGALNIKSEAVANAPSGPLTRYYPKSINYDVAAGAGWVEAEIGPAKGRKQWGLGNLLEYGGHGAAPQPHLEPALDHEEPRFIAATEVLAEKLTERLR